MLFMVIVGTTSLGIRIEWYRSTQMGVSTLSITQKMLAATAQTLTCGTLCLELIQRLESRVSKSHSNRIDLSQLLDSKQKSKFAFTDFCNTNLKFK